MEQVLVGAVTCILIGLVTSRLVQVRSKEDVLTCARHIHTDSLAPVFLTSSVTGDGLELVKLFFNLLPQRHKWADRVCNIKLSLANALCMLWRVNDQL